MRSFDFLSLVFQVHAGHLFILYVQGRQDTGWRFGENMDVIMYDFLYLHETVWHNFGCCYCIYAVMGLLVKVAYFFQWFYRLNCGRFVQSTQRSVRVTGRNNQEILVLLLQVISLLPIIFLHL